ncbi:hypothetical protein B0H34DRAFT_648113 [Crassisporium funariophilum]|nr:hypothetical protein B0H34DRAFT_648113 [Crassisporium funariophilum]
MAPRRRCPTCGSKQWHKEPSSGLIACSEGHVLQNYRNETTEMEEMGPHAMKKRTLKSGKGKKGRQSHADPKLYHGARGRYHYFLCLQLILRKQIAALVKLWDLPPEFEVICKDLWALNLTLLPDPLPAEPYFHAQENREGGELRMDPETVKKSKSQSADDLLDRSVPHFDSDDKEDEVDDTEQEVNQDAQDADDADPELEALMQENSEIATSSEEDGEDVPPISSKKSGKANKGYDSPVSTIAVLVVACWTLRIPVMYRDFSRIIETYELPYLDPIKLLPPSMVLHLTKHNVQALSPHHTPSTMTVHSVASRLARKLYRTYGVYTPEANAASMLWRLTKEMGGTPTLYMLTKRLAGVLSLPLTLDSSLAPGLQQTRAKDPLEHQYDNAPPEVSLLAALIMVLKMVYGLDGSPRGPKEKHDIACALPRVEEYMKMIERLNESDAKQTKVMFDSRNHMEVGTLSEEALDDYISFCGRILVGQGRVNGEVALSRYFPVEAAHETVWKGEDEDAVREMGGSEVKAEGLRPGEKYTIWNARDVDGRLAEEYALVVSRGSRVVGVEESYIGGVMEKWERRLVRWWELKSRMTSDGD